jgi:hypothetical protein
LVSVLMSVLMSVLAAYADEYETQDFFISQLVARGL